MEAEWSIDERGACLRVVFLGLQVMDNAVEGFGDRGCNAG
jgi:hypothetical protein